MTRFESAVKRQNPSRPPVWFMRQAGRYHSHYQKLKEKHSFIDLCKKPEVACEATMGPIQEFDFDAAILFSDLLFPLEVMGMDLSYDPGPKLGWYLREVGELKALDGGPKRSKDLVERLSFQGRALELIRKRLPKEKSLLGFVGGPLTLFFYAVEGSHRGELTSAKEGLKDGRFDGFFEKLADLLVENMVLQARSGADAIALLDTCAGEIDETVFGDVVVPALKWVIDHFKRRCPDTPLIYYSKGTGPEHWKKLVGLDFQCLGIDWNHDVSTVLQDWGKIWSIQGNIDPQWLFLESDELEKRLRTVFQKVLQLPPQARQGWICGLGHGVLPKTPEANVKLFLKLQREMFSEDSI